MIYADLPPALVDAGALALALTAILAAFAAFARTRPVRWLWSSLVAKPIGQWLSKQIEVVVAPLHTQIGSVGSALISHTDFEDDLRIADKRDRDLRQVEMDAWRGEVRGDISDVREDIGTIHKRLDLALTAMVIKKPEAEAPSA